MVLRSMTSHKALLSGVYAKSGAADRFAGYDDAHGVFVGEGEVANCKQPSDD